MFNCKRTSAQLLTNKYILVTVILLKNICQKLISANKILCTINEQCSLCLCFSHAKNIHWTMLLLVQLNSHNYYLAYAIFYLYFLEFNCLS